MKVIKKKGIMLLECMLSIFIILITIISFAGVNKEDVNSFKSRNEVRENNILMNNIINEIKFNTTIDELENKLIGNKIVIGIGENILSDLKTKDVLNIKDNFNKKVIEVEKVSGTLEKINLRISFVENGNKILKEEVEKELWMEQREKKMVLH